MYDYSRSELAVIDETIEPKLAWAKDGNIESQQLALDATRLLSCTEDRLDDYKNMGFFKRCWKGLSGKTGEMQRANQKDLAEMQRISWRYLNLLQERSLMTAHAIITVKNNLLTLAIAEQETRQEIERMANRIYERFEELENRVTKVEVASNIHSWLLTLDTRDYDEKLSPHFRLLRILKDFYSFKVGRLERPGTSLLPTSIEER
ncbi:MAG: hypothetical protein GX117_09400 [Candidatus Hydrogenedentes bacterium]|nr:hypothetical protein [Candidatus Hydrogenedentota bacterium]